MSSSKSKVLARCLRCDAYRLSQALKANEIAPENLVALSRRQPASPSPASAPKPDCPLTPRQLEILQLLAREDSHAKIATKLGIKESTVNSHISGICEKLDVPCARIAVAEALRRGIIE